MGFTSIWKNTNVHVRGVAVLGNGTFNVNLVRTKSGESGNTRIAERSFAWAQCIYVHPAELLAD